jgi:uncharacterized membrane protein YcaP (DUF421 family)
MQTVWHLLVQALGLDVPPKDLSFLQTTCRAIVIFISALIAIRTGDKRSLARKTAFDVTLIVILGAILSRAINGSASFFPTLVASFVLVFIHRVFAWLGFRWHWFGSLLKGRPASLIEHGQLNRAAMRRHCVSQDDLEEDLRLSLNEEELAKVRSARLERSGDVSFIPAREQ